MAGERNFLLGVRWTLVVLSLVPRFAYSQRQPPRGIPRIIKEWEGLYEGTWTWDRGGYTAGWDNKAIAKMKIVKGQFTPGSAITIERTDTPKSSTAGLTAVYSGKISAEGNRIVDGTVTWTWVRYPRGRAGPAPWTATWISKPTVVDIFVGGFFDGTRLGGSVLEGYFKPFKRAHPERDVKYFSYDGTAPDGGSTLESYVRDLPAGTAINLIGHSYGGDTAVNIAGRVSRSVNLLITIDPVGGRSVPVYPKPSSPHRPDPPPNPAWPRNIPPKLAVARAHTTTWIDVDAQPGRKDWSDDIAWLGGKWDTLPDMPTKYDSLFIPAVGKHHYEFAAMMTVVGSNGKTAEDMLLGR